MNMDKLINPRRQTNWDWRAAGNFIGGGSGSGLLLFYAIAAVSGLVSPLAGLMGLGLIGLGLFCVWMEIGRPLRAMNVFRHVQTSWMTREAMVAPPLFLCGLLSVWTGNALWAALTGLLAIAFLYCQARIVHAAKGVPAWRAQRSVPLLFATGLCEGAGFLAFVLAFEGKASQAAWLPVVLLPLLIARALFWRAYRRELSAQNTPRQALAALNKIEVPFIWTGHAATGTLIVAALAIPALNGAWLAGAAGLLVAVSGWLFKYTLIVRASFKQGYALPRLPVRGSGVPQQSAGARS